MSENHDIGATHLAGDVLFKKATIFWSYVKYFCILAGVRNYRTLTVYKNKFSWIAQSYFSIEIIKRSYCQLLFLLFRLFMEKKNYCHRYYYCKHSPKKWKDSQETRAILLIFSLEFEISGVAVQSIHQNSEKWRFLWGFG